MLCVVRAKWSCQLQLHGQIVGLSTVLQLSAGIVGLLQWWHDPGNLGQRFEADHYIVGSVLSRKQIVFTWWMFFQYYIQRLCTVTKIKKILCKSNYDKRTIATVGQEFHHFCGLVSLPPQRCYCSQMSKMGGKRQFCPGGSNASVWLQFVIYSHLHRLSDQRIWKWFQTLAQTSAKMSRQEIYFQSRIFHAYLIYLKEKEKDVCTK